MTGSLELKNVFKNFPHSSGTEVHALKDISLSVAPGELVCLLGPTGCGKTTLLRLVAGLENPDRGSVLLDGVIPSVTGKVGFVFQQGTLFPWMTVKANIEFGLRAQGTQKHTRRKRIDELLELVELTDFSDSYPYQLSGGMQQRVALVRSLATDPEILLLDEPFSALDTHTRHNLEDVALDLWKATGTTVLFVTHHIEEAIYLAQKLVILGHRPGRVVREEAVDLKRPRDRLSEEFEEYLLSVRETFEELVNDEMHYPSGRRLNDTKPGENPSG